MRPWRILCTRWHLCPRAVGASAQRQKRAFESPLEGLSRGRSVAPRPCWAAVFRHLRTGACRPGSRSPLHRRRRRRCCSRAPPPPTPHSPPRRRRPRPTPLARPAAASLRCAVADSGPATLAAAAAFTRSARSVPPCSSLPPPPRPTAAIASRSLPPPPRPTAVSASRSHRSHRRRRRRRHRRRRRRCCCRPWRPSSAAVCSAPPPPAAAAALRLTRHRSALHRRVPHARVACRE